MFYSLKIKTKFRFQVVTHCSLLKKNHCSYVKCKSQTATNSLLQSKSTNVTASMPSRW